MLRNLLLCSFILVMAVPARAIEFGWESLSDGGVEYIIQVEPELISTFREQGFTSSIPGTLRDIRRIRIQVGASPLPNQGDLEGPKPADKVAAGADSHAADPAPPAELPTKSTPPKSDTADATPPGNEQPQSGDGTPDLGATSGQRPPLPFLHAGPLKQLATAPNNAATEASPNPTDSGKPRLAPGETFVTPAGGMEQESQTVRAEKPTDPGSAGAGIDSRADSRPWLLLMLILIVLFASIAGNVYLVWIYQTARAQYRLLARRIDPAMPRAS